jgi:hypothetical protein
MKKTKGRGLSTQSIKKENQNTFAPLGMSTPAKITVDDFERMDDLEGENTIYGIPNTIDQIQSNSALVNQLKILLQNAMNREAHLANFIEKL